MADMMEPNAFSNTETMARVGDLNTQGKKDKPSQAKP
jgi:hypothetical protein